MMYALVASPFLSFFPHSQAQFSASYQTIIERNIGYKYDSSPIKGSDKYTRDQFMNMSSNSFHRVGKRLQVENASTRTLKKEKVIEKKGENNKKTTVRKNGKDKKHAESFENGSIGVEAKIEKIIIEDISNDSEGIDKNNAESFEDGSISEETKTETIIIEDIFNDSEGKNNAESFEDGSISEETKTETIIIEDIANDSDSLAISKDGPISDDPTFSDPPAEDRAISDDSTFNDPPADINLPEVIAFPLEINSPDNKEKYNSSYSSVDSSISAYPSASPVTFPYIQNSETQDEIVAVGLKIALLDYDYTDLKDIQKFGRLQRRVVDSVSFVVAEIIKQDTGYHVKKSFKGAGRKLSTVPVLLSSYGGERVGVRALVSLEHSLESAEVTILEEYHNPSSGENLLWIKVILSYIVTYSQVENNTGSATNIYEIALVVDNALKSRVANGRLLQNLQASNIKIAEVFSVSDDQSLSSSTPKGFVITTGIQKQTGKLRIAGIILLLNILLFTVLLCGISYMRMSKKSDLQDSDVCGPGTFPEMVKLGSESDVANFLDVKYVIGNPIDSYGVELEMLDKRGSTCSINRRNDIINPEKVGATLV